MDRIGEVGDWASEGQAIEVYGTRFTAGTLVRVGVRDEMWGQGIKFGSVKELMEIGRMVEGD